MKPLIVISARKQISVGEDTSHKEEWDVAVQQVENLSSAFAGRYDFLKKG